MPGLFGRKQTPVNSLLTNLPSYTFADNPYPVQGMPEFEKVESIISNMEIENIRKAARVKFEENEKSILERGKKIGEAKIQKKMDEKISESEKKLNATLDKVEKYAYVGLVSMKINDRTENLGVFDFSKKVGSQLLSELQFEQIKNDFKVDTEKAGLFDSFTTFLSKQINKITPNFLTGEDLEKKYQEFVQKFEKDSDGTDLGGILVEPGGRINEFNTINQNDMQVIVKKVNDHNFRKIFLGGASKLIVNNQGENIVPIEGIGNYTKNTYTFKAFVDINQVRFDDVLIEFPFTEEVIDFREKKEDAGEISELKSEGIKTIQEKITEYVQKSGIARWIASSENEFDEFKKKMDENAFNKTDINNIKIQVLIEEEGEENTIIDLEKDWKYPLKDINDMTSKVKQILQEYKDALEPLSDDQEKNWDEKQSQIFPSSSSNSAMVNMVGTRGSRYTKLNFDGIKRGVYRPPKVEPTKPPDVQLTPSKVSDQPQFIPTGTDKKSDADDTDSLLKTITKLQTENKKLQNQTKSIKKLETENKQLQNEIKNSATGMLIAKILGGLLAGTIVSAASVWYFKSQDVQNITLDLDQTKSEFNEARKLVDSYENNFTFIQEKMPVELQEYTTHALQTYKLAELCEFYDNDKLCHAVNHARALDNKLNKPLYDVIDSLGIQIKTQKADNVLLQDKFKDLSKLKGNELVVLQNKNEDLLNRLGIKGEEATNASKALSAIRTEFNEVLIKKKETEEKLTEAKKSETNYKYSTYASSTLSGLMAIAIGVLARAQNFGPAPGV